MSNNVYNQLSRRNLLKYLGNSVLFFPVMRAFNDTQVFGADVAPRRAVFFYFPSGIIDTKNPQTRLMTSSEFHPAAGALGTLPSMTKPLERVKKDIIIIRNSTYATGGSHEGGMRYAISGVPNAGKATSIDTILGKQFKGVHDVVRLGIRTNFEGGGASQSCSFDNGILNERWDNPSYAFEQLFGGTAPKPTPDGGMTTPAPMLPTSGLTNKSKKSLFDANIQQLSALQAKLGYIEKEKLDAHITAIRDLERRIQMTDTGTGGGGGGGGGGGQTSMQCTRKINFTKTFDPKDKNSYDGTFKRVENYDAVADMQCEIAIQALACRITNVLLLQHGFSVFEMTFSGGKPAAGGKGHHSNGHYEAEGNRADHIADQQYMMNKFANLIEGLGKISEGGKSVLYNSSMMAFSELGDSSAHSMDNVPIVLAGQGGGYFKTGQCVDANLTPHSKTLVSIFESFGMNGKPVGDDKDGKPMPGLKA